jgi:uncharacterized protein (TIGR04255 family)
MTAALPKFNNPPVVEAILTVAFEATGLDVRHFGLYYETVKSRFPRFAVQPPIPLQVEKYDQPKTQLPQVRLMQMEAPDLRCWFESEDEHTLVQIQSNHFILNWKKEADGSYPNYEETIRPLFEREWKIFRNFLSLNGLKDPKIVQCEVTYTNHLEINEGWNTAADLGRVLPLLSLNKPSFLPPPEDIALTLRYRMPRDSGRMTVRLTPAIRHKDGIEILVLSLASRGAPSESTDEAVMAWLDMGREWCVRGFTDLTSPEMHKIWKRIR